MSQFRFSVPVPVLFLPRHTAASISAKAIAIFSWDRGLSP